MKRLLCFFAAAAAACAQTALVTITDTDIRDTAGAPFTGTFTVKRLSAAPATQSMGPGNPLLYVKSGVLSASATAVVAVTLYPGTYQVTKRSTAGLVDSGLLWTVPSSGPVAVWQIESRAAAVPASTFNYNLIGGLTAGHFITGGASGATAPADLQYVSATTAPAAPSLSVAGTPGSTTYGYRVAYTYPTGQSAPSAETRVTNGPATPNGADHVVITAPACSGSNEVISVYRTTPAYLAVYSDWVGNVACGGTLSDLGGGILTLLNSGDLTGGLAASHIGAASAVFGDGNVAYFNPSSPHPYGAILNATQRVASSDGLMGANLIVVNDGGSGAFEVGGAQIFGYQDGGQSDLVHGAWITGTAGNWRSGRTTNVTSVRGVVANAETQAPGTVGDIVGLLASANVQGGATVGEAIGIKITDVTGASSNRALKTGLGIVEFGDLVDASVKGIKLPTSCSGLAAGTLYNNNGTPAICQ